MRWTALKLVSVEAEVKDTSANVEFSVSEHESESCIWRLYECVHSSECLLSIPTQSSSLIFYFFFPRHRPAINHNPVLNAQQRCKQFVIDGAENEHSRVHLLCMEKHCKTSCLVRDFFKQEGVENDRNLQGSVRFEGRVNYDGEHLFVLWGKRGNRKS